MYKYKYFLQIYFKYSCIAKSALLSSDMNVNQGEWHNIQFEVNQNQGLLTIDGKRVDDSLVGCKPFNIGSPYYLGGMDTITLETATEHLEVRIMNLLKRIILLFWIFIKCKQWIVFIGI